MLAGGVAPVPPADGGCLIALFVERWWGFRLTCEPDGTLRVRRGPFHPPVAVGVRAAAAQTVGEPPLVRALGCGAQAGALTVGLAGSETEKAHGGALRLAGPAGARSPHRRGRGWGLEGLTRRSLRTRRRTHLPVIRAVVPALVFRGGGRRVAAAGGPGPERRRGPARADRRAGWA
ncbi:hypothetical protein HBB16_16750 [Pseudonocardia sp. MCCB 268]|nr:hypothetical protein [Pseudonocardia cytotoxica]